MASITTIIINSTTTARRSEKISGIKLGGKQCSASECYIRHRMLITNEFMDDLPAICVIKNQYCAFVYANKAMGKSFAPPTGGFFGKTDYHIMNDADAAVIREHDKSVLASGVDIETVEWVHDSDVRTGYLVSKFRLQVRNRVFLGVIGVPLVVTHTEEAAITQGKTWLRENETAIRKSMHALLDDPSVPWQ